MTNQRRIFGRIGLLLTVFGLCALILGAACDRKAQRGGSAADMPQEADKAEKSAEGSADIDNDKSADKSSDKNKHEGDLPGEAVPGTIQPESPGPEAPAVFFLSGLKGYLEPCGCSAEILLGGIERITGYVEAARKLHPASVMLDAGDLLIEFAENGEHEIPQVKARADVIVQAQKALKTRVTVPGEIDFALGTDFYLEKIKEAGVTPIAANLKIAGKALEPGRVLEVGDIKLGVVGAVDPELYAGLEGVSVEDPTKNVKKAVDSLKKQGATTLVLLMHGDLPATRRVLEAVDGLQFAVVGHEPRETDEVNEVNGAYTLEAFDQGRYLGVLKLYERDVEKSYQNAGAASESELEKLDRLIAHKKQQIDRFPPSKRHENPPIIQRLQKDMDELKARVAELRSSSIEVREAGNAFIYRPVPMEPGLPIMDSVEEARRAFNHNLKALQMQTEREVVPPKDGEPFFVGTNQCATCHVSEHDFWKKTAHASAVETLEVRDKLFDQNCIGCHVVGYEKPGGSVIGQLKYEAPLGDRTIEKDLENVGCESCHGPGSEHVQKPVDAQGKPHSIHGTPVEANCMECHVPEHSPKFNFEAYVEDITGPGHERR